MLSYQISNKYKQLAEEYRKQYAFALERAVYWENKVNPRDAAIKAFLNPPKDNLLCNNIRALGILKCKDKLKFVEMLCLYIGLFIYNKKLLKTLLYPVFSFLIKYTRYEQVSISDFVKFLNH